MAVQSPRAAQAAPAPVAAQPSRLRANRPAAGHFAGMTGNGLVDTDQNPDYAEFGRFFISLPDLGQGRLHMVNEAGRKVGVKCDSMSDSLKRALTVLAHGGELSETVLSALDHDELELLKRVCRLAHATRGSGNDEVGRKKARTKLVQSMIMEGNDAPELQHELKHGNTDMEY